MRGGSDLWDSPAGAIAGEDFFTPDIVAPAGPASFKYWNGSSWVLKPLKRWNGTAWVQYTLKRWNGTAWITE